VTSQATTQSEPQTSTPPSVRTARPPGRLGPWDLLVLAAWCGLAGGLLEVGTRVVCRLINPVHRLYMMNRHFFWVTPLVNLLLLFGLGICLAALAKVGPRLVGKIGPRLIVAFGVLPMLMVAEPRIFPEAWFVLALGAAVWFVPFIDRFPGTLRRRLLQTFPLLLAVDLMLAAGVFGSDWLKLRREAARPVPPAGSPNVLFIVLDTVRADRMSLYGYERPTTPTLERLAKRGVRFDAARATAPWTLPSHASFFSGRWPHELEVEWATPLPPKNYPMLAEYLGAHGYATAGIVANMYCAYDTGVNRGFTHYEDYVFERLGFLRTSVVVEEVVKNSIAFGLHSPSGFMNRAQSWLRSTFDYSTRKDARTISGQFLKWLDQKQQPGRPFFVFLNYLDAHTPYKVPPGKSRRFGRKPQTDEEVWVIYDQWVTLEKLLLKKPLLTMGRDCYDSCLAYLDDQISELIDDLERRGVLENTWIVFAGDHGEGLGEHYLFDHGESLYSQEIHVPLVLLPPSNITLGAVVRQPVSLRDLPATVVDLTGLAPDSPFPGHSLRALWKNNFGASKVTVSDVLSELASPSPINSSHGQSPARRGPLVSLAEGDLLYIRNEGDGTEELFNLREDPHELTNKALSASMQPVLSRFRDRLAEIKRR
jgi:arylsulfatase A-like enzyme